MARSLAIIPAQSAPLYAATHEADDFADRVEGDPIQAIFRKA